MTPGFSVLVVVSQFFSAIGQGFPSPCSFLIFFSSFFFSFFGFILLGMFCSSFSLLIQKTVIVKLLVIHVLILLGIVGTPGLCVLVIISSVQHLVSDFFLLVFVLISFFFFFFIFLGMFCGTREFGVNSAFWYFLLKSFLSAWHWK